VVAVIKCHSVMNTVMKVCRKSGRCQSNLLLFKCSFYVADSNIVTSVVSLTLRDRKVKYKINFVLDLLLISLVQVLNCHTDKDVVTLQRHDTLLWLMRLLACPYPRSFGFDPRPVHLGIFCTACGTGGRCFSEYFNFPFSVSFHQCSVFINVTNVSSCLH
jgi:hypothetical protein